MQWLKEIKQSLISWWSKKKPIILKEDGWFVVINTSLKWSISFSIRLFITIYIAVLFLLSLYHLGVIDRLKSTLISDPVSVTAGDPSNLTKESVVDYKNDIQDIDTLLKFLRSKKNVEETKSD